MASYTCFSVCLSLVVHTSVYHAQAGRGEGQFSPIFPFLILKPPCRAGVVCAAGPWPLGLAPPARRSAPAPGCGRPPGSAGAAGTGGSGWGAVQPGWPAPSSSAASWAPPAGRPPGPSCIRTARRCEARGPGTGRLPRGSAAGRGWAAARAGPEGAARAAGPGSPSGGPRGSRAAPGGRPERALAAERRRRSWRGEAPGSSEDGKRASRGGGGGCCWEIRSKDHDSSEAAQQQIARAAAASVVTRGHAPCPPTSLRRPNQDAPARPRPRLRLRARRQDTNKRLAAAGHKERALRMRAQRALLESVP